MMSPRKQIVVIGAAVLGLSGTSEAQERVIPLDTVTATAVSHAARDLATSTRAVEVITRAEIRRLPVTSVQDVLEWAFGVDLMARSPALADVGIRGSSYEQVLVLVDGVRVSDPQTGHFHLNLAVPLAQVERIEVLRGPASALHGADAFGGVINVVTRQVPPSGISARAEAGSFGTRNLAAALTLGGRSGSGDIAVEHRESGGHRVGTDSRVRTARAGLQLPVSEHTLALDLAAAARDFGADGFYGPFPSYEETRTTTAAIALRAPTAARVSIEPRLTLRRNADDFTLRRSEPDGYRNQHETLSAGGDLLGRLHVSPLLRLAAGGELYSERLESATLGDREEGRGALFVESVAGRVGHATVTAGLRRDWGEAHDAIWSPSAAAAWWPFTGVRLRGSVGRSFRTPSWTDRFYSDPANVGDPDLQPEHAWSSEVGVSAFHPAGGQVTASAFRREARDLIDWAKPLGQPQEPFRTRNVNEARFSGLELEVKPVEVLGVRTVARGSWLSVSSSAEPGYQSKYALRPLVESFTISVERALGRNATLSLRGHRNRRSEERAYTTLDGRAAYRFGSTRIYLDVRNAADEAYLDISGNPAPGRSLQLGVEYR